MSVLRCQPLECIHLMLMWFEVRLDVEGDLLVILGFHEWGLQRNVWSFEQTVPLIFNEAVECLAYRSVLKMECRLDIFQDCRLYFVCLL